MGMYEIVFNLKKEDILAFQMYESGESEYQKKRRKRNRLLVPVIYGLIAIMAFFKEFNSIGAGILVFSVVWFFLYPTYAKWFHCRHFKKHIEEKYKNELDTEGILRLEEERFFSYSEDGEIKLKYSAIENLVELEKFYLIRLKLAVTFLLPKERIPKEKLEPFIQEVSKRTGLDIKDHKKRLWK